MGKREIRSWILGEVCTGRRGAWGCGGGCTAAGRRRHGCPPRGACCPRPEHRDIYISVRRRAPSSLTRARVALSLISFRILVQAWMTVVWSLPPNACAILG